MKKLVQLAVCLQEKKDMRQHLKTFKKAICLLFSYSWCQFLIRLVLATCLFLLWRQAFAGDDPLEGTDKSLVATLGSGGTGRKFIYLIEAVTAIATYIKTKNILMFSGVVAIAIFLNILFTVAGVS